MKRQCSAEFRSEWPIEISDLCAASFASCFERRRREHDFNELQDLFACYTHDDRAHLKSAARILKAGANPVVLDLAFRGFRFVLDSFEYLIASN